MSPPRKAIWLVLAIMMAGLIGTALFPVIQEPSFQGRSLSRWLSEFNSIPPEKPAPEVSRAIQGIGPSAVPYLLAYIWSDEPQQISLVRKWVNSTFHRSYRSRTDLCAPSWRALSILGPNATSALPEISRHAWQGPLQGRAMIALAALGTNSISTLTELCGHSNLEVRVDAAFLLAKSTVNMRGLESFIAISGTSGQPMLAYNIQQGIDDLEQLVANLHHNNPAVRRASAEAIGSDAKMSRLAQPNLRECLQDPDPSVRDVVAKILTPEGSVAAQQ